jgi:ADP-ribose pyrophosphatase YjhB (NUDIX family)
MENIKRYAGIIVKYKDEVLLCKRNADNDLPGVWSIPAGRLEDDENPTLGAKREFHEETNVKVKDKIDRELFTITEKINISNIGKHSVVNLSTDTT